MLRRCLRLLCPSEDTSRADLPGGMSLALALKTFNFGLSENIEKHEIKKRYAMLALKHHPDRGGKSEDFQQIVAAQKILLSMRHDKHKERPKAEFKTYRPNSPTTQMKEEAKYGKIDVVFFLLLLSGIIVGYFYRIRNQHTRVLQQRRNMLPSEVSEIENPKRTGDVWHPWHADSDQKSHVEEVAVLQGVIRRDVLDERRKELDYIQNHPLAPAKLLR
jgi:hypothetical protein